MEMENIVSEFLVSTCRVRSTFDITKHFGLFESCQLIARSYGSMGCIQIVCGSQAEFYIQPVKSCIDDLDMLIAANCYLALDPSCEIHDVAGDLCDIIFCFKFESYEQNKSFVRLSDPTIGVYDWSLEEYRFDHANPTSLMHLINFPSPANMMAIVEQISEFSTDLKANDLSWVSAIGPAIKGRLQPIIAIDFVISMFFPNWPLVAEEWPKRKRFSGWPDSATTSKVVHGGCDVVSVKHRDMQDELHQRRLSFSRAEITLIQSWSPTQQIVYHLLRYFAKKEIMRKNCPKNEEVVCTYHLKTLMLWSCEEESKEWWKTSSVVAICCNLCGKLCECLLRKHCPNYFIPEANLFDHEMSYGVLRQTIKTLDCYKDVNRMSQWFLAHYILPVYQAHCDEGDTNLTEEKVAMCSISVCDYNEKRKISDLNSGLRLCAESCFPPMSGSFNFQFRDKIEIGGIAINANWFIDTTFISKVYGTLATYIKALTLVQISQFIVNPKFQFDVEIFILSDIWIHFIKRRFNFIEIFNFWELLSADTNSVLYFNRTEQMMKHLAFGYSVDERYFITMVSMLCLHKSLCCLDEYSYKTETASMIYLAALFYDIGRLQCAGNICSHVTTNFKKSDHCSGVRYLKVNSLLFVDDLAAIAGFLMLRRKILRIRNKGIFLLSPELFAYYLLFQCNSERLKIRERFGMILSFEADCCLAAILRYKILRRTGNTIHKTLLYSRFTEELEVSATEIVLPGQTDVAEVFARISNDYMTSFYASVSEEFGTKFNLASCYEALSLYLYRRYENVIGLCEKLLEEPEHDSEVEKFQFLNVNVSLHFIAYFDEDIQALVGFQLLVLRLSSMQHYHILEDILYDNRNQRAISAYNTFCETFNPILRKQFLGNYLKLRCLLDLGLPLFEVRAALQCLKSHLLFENTLVQFMRQKVIWLYRGTATM